MISPADATVPARRMQHVLLLLLIAGITLAAYSNTFQSPFVFDDYPRIVENHQIRNLDNFLKFGIITTHRPLVDFTFALNYHFHGLEVWGYHLVNALIHILNGWLVYFITLQIVGVLYAPLPTSHFPLSTLLSSPQRAMALATALFFTLHPLQTQAVTYIVQRYTSLAALFYLAAILLYILGRQAQIGGARSDKSRRSLWLKAGTCFALTLLCSVLAFLSKQHTASLPGAIMLVEYILFDRTWAGWKRKLAWLVPAVALFVLAVLYNVGFFTKSTGAGLLEDVSALMQETGDISRLTYLYTQFRVITLYLLMLVAPVFQSLDHMYPFVNSFWSGWTPLSLALLLTMAAGGMLARKNYPLISLGIGWLFITLSVESSIIPIRDAMFEHRMYLPMVGAAWLLLALLIRVWPGALGRRVAIAAGLVILLGLGGMTYARNLVWQDERDLWKDAVARNPTNHRAHTSIGVASERLGEGQKAHVHYYEALRLRPNYAYANHNMGVIMAKHNRLEEAEYYFRRALTAQRLSATVHSNLGITLMRQERSAEGIQHLKEAVRLNRYFVEARFNLGLALFHEQFFEEAREQFEYVLKINPHDADAQTMLQHLEGGKFGEH